MFDWILLVLENTRVLLEVSMIMKTLGKSRKDSIVIIQF